MSVFALLSRSSPTEWIIPRGSSIVTGLSVRAISWSGITCRYSVVTVTGPGRRLARRRGAGLAHRAHVAGERHFLAVARELAARRRDPERGLARLGLREHRVGDFGGLVVAEVARERAGDGLDRPALRVERHRAKALHEEVGVVARGAVLARYGYLHLRVEPVGERREAAQQQHRRPGGRAIEPAAYFARHVSPAGRPKGLTRPRWGQRAKRAWGSFHVHSRRPAVAARRGTSAPARRGSVRRVRARRRHPRRAT